MGLLDTFSAIAKNALPFLKDVKQTLDPIVKTSEDDEGFINIKKGIGAVISSQKDGKGFTFKPPPTPKPVLGSTKQISFRDRSQQTANLPGLTNPYIKSLYDIYDLNKIRKINTILKDSDIEFTKPSPPKGVTLKVGD
jgi:hypothetical protein